MTLRWRSAKLAVNTQTSHIVFQDLHSKARDYIRVGWNLRFYSLRLPSIAVLRCRRILGSRCYTVQPNSSWAEVRIDLA